MQWIDRKTRAVFIEFSSYNPNIKLIMVSTILVEFLESGSILTTATFDPLNLFNGISGGITSFGNISILIVIAFIYYFMFVQIKEIFNVGLKEYLSDFWSYIEWSIIITAWISFIMFLLRIINAQEILTFFKKTQGYGYINLQQVNAYNQILTFSLGLCSTLGSIKFLKMLIFNRNISFLGLTLKNCFGELTSFTFVFFIIWFSFVQVMYLVYGTDIVGYSSIINSMETTFQIMLGKIDVSRIQQDELVILGPIIFSAYNVAVIFFVLNIFISIITDSFDKVRAESKLDQDKFDFMKYIWNKIKTSLKNKKRDTFIIKQYLDKNDLSNSVDNLNNFIIRVSKKKFNCFKRTKKYFK
jgi:polycystin 2